MPADAEHVRDTGRAHHVSLPLLAGEWVTIRDADEILATLDKAGCLDGMPFMPEMLQYCGQSVRVFKRAHKTCDTLYQSGARGIERTVHLEGLRCDGSAHDGCQAQCLLFWKEAWLKPSHRVDTASSAAQPVRASGCSVRDLMGSARGAGAAERPRYVCQATELLSATRPLSSWDARQYLEDYRSRNVDVATLLRGAAYRLGAYAVRRASWLEQRLPLGGRLSRGLMRAYDSAQARLPGGVPYPRRTGSVPKGQRTPQGEDASSFRPGSLVRVKSYPEILATLDVDNKNRGLFFDAENVPYCGKELRVRALVDHIVDERTGHMLQFKTPAIVLEGAYCRGTYSDKRMFCPRAVYPYWRPVWLTLLEQPQSQPQLPASEAEPSAPQPEALLPSAACGLLQTRSPGA